LFTKPDLAKLASPIFPDPVTDPCSNNNRDGDREEDAPCRRAVFLVELVTMSGACNRSGFVHFGASNTGCASDAAVARGRVVLDPVLVCLAIERVVWKWEAFDQFACAVLLTFVVPVTANC